LIVKRPRRPETAEVRVFDFAPDRLEEMRCELVRLFEGSEPGQWVPGAGDSGLAVDGASAEAG
jgi:hypothetical protein